MRNRIVLFGIFMLGWIASLTIGPNEAKAQVATIPATCKVIKQAVTSVGVSAVNVPLVTDGGTALQALKQRQYIVICNSPENSGTPKVKCRADNTAPVMGATTIGDVIEKGDCVTYTTSNVTATSGAAVQCIADTASTSVATFECSVFPGAQ